MAAPRLQDSGHDTALGQYRRRAASYDAELAFFEPIRRRALALLAAQRGETVLDLGCGTGLSLPPLAAAVGRAGRIVGVELSPEMLALARERTADLPQVSLVESAAEDARLQGRADAAMFHFTHDILQSDRALDHVFKHLRPGARVVASGLQWAPTWAVAANLFVLPAALYSVSSLEGLDQPWRGLAARLQGWRIESHLFGAVFVGSGHLPA